MRKKRLIPKGLQGLVPLLSYGSIVNGQYLQLQQYKNSLSQLISNALALPIQRPTTDANGIGLVQNSLTNNVSTPKASDVPINSNPNTIYKTLVDELTGKNIDYKGLAIAAGVAVGLTVGQAVGGKTGMAISLGFGSLGTVINSALNLKTIGDLSAKGVKGLGTAKAGNIAAIAGSVLDIAGSFLPEKSEYAGEKGDVTLTMDLVYDGISNVAMAFGPVGMIVGGAMKGAAFLGKGLGALGGGTDAMTTSDAILGSSFLNLTPIGLINGFGGSKAETITRDKDAFEQVGSSYGGTARAVNNALVKSGKKYGLFSTGAREQADDEIREAKRQQKVMSEIAAEALDRFAIKNSMSAINGNRRQYQMQGGYDLSAVRMGRYGMELLLLRGGKKVIQENLERFPILSSLNVEFYQDNKFRPKDDIGEGGNIEYMSAEHDTLPYYNDYAKPDNLKGKSVVVYNGDATDEDIVLDVLSHGLREQDQNWKNVFLPKLAKDPEWLEGIFNEKFEDFSGLNYEEYKKLPKLKKRKLVEDFRDSEEFTLGLDGLIRAIVVKDDMRKQLRYEYPEEFLSKLKATPVWEEAYKYILTGEVPEQSVPAGKLGMKIEDTFVYSEIPDFVYSEIPDDEVAKFQKGGSINIIPEGALHARKHNIDLEGITKKGIPVVSLEEGGEIVQQAEIEHSEVILRLEVTEQIEKWQKEYEKTKNDQIAIEAGKLLVLELLYNTDDRTDLINLV